MKKKVDQETEDWLIAFFNGELDEAEEVRVGEWVAASEENRQAYEALMYDFLRVRWVQENVSIREERAREIIFSSLKKKKRSVWFYYGMAASVAVLLSAAVFLLVREEKQVVPDRASIAKVEPVRARATLILSSGKQVLLTDTNQEIQEQNGYTLKVDSMSGVRYDSLAGEQRTERMFNKIVVPRGGEYFLTLSDGTKVWLDADSELEYPVAFSGDSREVRLKGEAYFSVTSESRSFVVRVDDYSLRVYGTEFNVNAYNVREIQTVLVKGTIGIRANVSAPERMMKPNELAVADVETGQCEIREVDIYPYIAWRSQDIVFENERLEAIMEKVARWYDVTVFFQNEGLKNLRFDCNMRRYANIEELFFFMEQTSDARFVLNGRTVVVSEKE